MAKKTISMEEILENEGKPRKNRGKYYVIGVDKFSNEDWLHGFYKTAKQALAESERKTIEQRKYASDSSVATVYYAYNPKGKYLG